MGIMTRQSPQKQDCDFCKLHVPFQVGQEPAEAAASDEAPAAPERQEAKEQTAEEKAESASALKALLEALARELFGIRTAGSVRNAADFILKVTKTAQTKAAPWPLQHSDFVSSLCILVGTVKFFAV